MKDETNAQAVEIARLLADHVVGAKVYCVASEGRVVTVIADSGEFKFRLAEDQDGMGYATPGSKV
jgi:hypothetical protein